MFHIKKCLTFIDHFDPFYNSLLFTLLEKGENKKTNKHLCSTCTPCLSQSPSLLRNPAAQAEGQPAERNNKDAAHTQKKGVKKQAGVGWWRGVSSPALLSPC